MVASKSKFLIVSLLFMASLFQLTSARAQASLATQIENTPDELYGTWQRITTKCGAPLTDSELNQVLQTGHAGMSVRALLKLEEEKFIATVLSGEACRLSPDQRPEKTDNQSLNCEQPAASRGTVSFDTANKTVFFEAKEELANGWGVKIDRANYKVQSDVLLLAIDGVLNYCSQQETWNTYWVRYQGS